jgi:hypothetical protein
MSYSVRPLSNRSLYRLQPSMFTRLNTLLPPFLTPLSSAQTQTAASGKYNRALCKNLLTFNPLNAELNPICHLLTLLGPHHILRFSRIRVKNRASYIEDRRTATLQMLHFICFSTSVSTEYFKHAAHFPFFSSKCCLFHNVTFLGSCIIHILHTGCAKIWM